MTLLKKIFENKKNLIIYIVICSCIGLIYGIRSGTSHSKTYSDIKTKEFIQGCIEENKQLYTLLGKNSEQYPTDQYCSCLANGSLELAKNSKKMENPLLSMEFLDTYSQDNCGEYELFSTFSQEDHYRMSWAICSNLGTLSEEACECFAQTIAEESITENISTYAGLQVYFLKNPGILSACQNR